MKFWNLFGKKQKQHKGVAPLYCIVCAQPVGVINRDGGEYRSYRRGLWVYTCKECRKRTTGQREYLANANNRRYTRQCKALPR